MREFRWAISVLAAIAVAVPAGAARADQGPVTRSMLDAPVHFAPGGDRLIVGTTLDLAAGESRHLQGRLEATSSTTVIVAMNATVKCLSGTTQVGISSTSSRNHEGRDTTSYAVDGHLPLVVDLLFTAPAAGSYRCGLYGRTATNQSGLTYHLSAVAGGKTWLAASQTNQVGAHWWQNPPCDSRGTSSTCTYVGPGQPDSAFVFYEPGLPHDKWTVGGDARFVQALANVTVTTCYRGTASCDRVPEANRLARTVGSHSLVAVRLEVLQMDGDGSHTCNTTRTARSVKTMLDDAHHYTAYLSLPSVPVLTSCGRQFMMRVYVEHVSGSPVKIDGVQGATSLTNGIMMNL
ncbi:MAG TPA: hypothetical protein VK453_03820 [Micromonosporaceae bacterium]|nr:hypothetical protein [Micromonosporaceae bacterium]